MTDPARQQILALIGILLVAAGGCQRQARKPEPLVTAPQAFSSGGNAPLQQAWWHAFEDKALDGLIDRALAENFDLRTAWDRLAQAQAIARDQVETNKKVLDVVTIQFRKGAAAAADVLRQRQLVAATEATVISVEETTALLQYTLSVLIGAEPTLAWTESDIELPPLPPMPDPGVPSEVLLRRPDVHLAYRQVQAADQRLAAAIADQYPRISLSAGIETAVPKISDLFDDWLANLAGNLAQPLIDAGRRKAEVQRREAIVSERMHTWSQAILNALQDVETALTQEKQQTQLLANLNVRLRLARQTYERNRERFIKGQIDYIRVLESLQSLQALELNVVSAQRALIQRRIDLYRSIAGPADLPQPTLALGDEATWNRSEPQRNSMR